MKLFIGADHRGFTSKEALKERLGQKYEVVDVGASSYEGQDDFVDFAKEVAIKVSTDRQARGILLCGSGVGMCIAANKVPGIRCGVGYSVEEVTAARHDDDINILALSADYPSKSSMDSLIDAFLATPFIPEERFTRRIAKITELEHNA